MKLISMQSRGNRLVRVISRNGSLNDCETIEKEWLWHNIQGLRYEQSGAYCGPKYYALKRAAKWLEEATT